MEQFRPGVVSNITTSLQKEGSTDGAGAYKRETRPPGESFSVDSNQPI